MSKVISTLDLFPNVCAVEMEKIWERAGLTAKFAQTWDRREQLRLANESDYIVVGVAPVDEEMLRTSPKLKAVHKWGVGFEKIDLRVASELGVRVLITAGGNAIPVAEHAVMLVLAAYKRLAWVDSMTRSGGWVTVQREQRTFSHHIAGKRVGVFGFGNIGRAFARIIGGFGTAVSYYDAFRPNEKVEKEMNVSFKLLDELFATSDILSIHAPLNDDTYHIVNAERLQMMPRGAVLVNCARGGLVDEEALCESLRSGHLAAAGLDVFNEEPLTDSPLFGLPNVVVTPHIGGGTFNNVSNLANQILRNLAALEEGREIPASCVVV